MGQPRWSGSVKGSGGGSGTVKKVASANGSIAVTTPTIDPTIEVAKVPASALVSGTRITIATSAGKAEISAAATTKVTLAGDVTGTSTANVVSKVPAAAVTAGTNIAVTTVTGKAEVSTDALGGDVTGTLAANTVAKVPAAAVTAGTNIAVTTVTGKAEVSTDALGGDVTGTLAANTVAKVPAAAVTAGTGTTITTVTGKAKVGVPTAPITAETSATGVALIDGTQTILTATVPNDGKVHALAFAVCEKDVTTAFTGGACTLSWTTPEGTARSIITSSTNVGAHFIAPTSGDTVLKPGTTVTVKQASAITTGAGKVYAKIVII